jgi:hypothetical protein
MNPQLINRVVGYFEYGQALARFTRFVTIASPEEVKLADLIASDAEECKVYTNLSRRIEARPGPLSERSDPKDTFERTGLGWLMALARLELAAIVAGFSPDSDAFAKGRPSDLEFDAYRELLEDAMRTHYWSLARDQALRKMSRGITPDQQAIAYLRRTNLAIKFLVETRNELKGQLTTAQQAELDTWEEQLRDLRSYLMFDVLGLHDAIVFNKSSPENLYLHKCGTTREQILEDIRSGKATVNGADARALAQLEKELGGPVPSSTKPNSTGQNSPSATAQPGKPGTPVVPTSKPSTASPPAVSPKR